MPCALALLGHCVVDRRRLHPGRWSQSMHGPNPGLEQRGWPEGNRA